MTIRRADLRGVISIEARLKAPEALTESPEAAATTRHAASPERRASSRLAVSAAILAAALGMAGCGGTGLLKDPLPLSSDAAVAAVADEHLLITVDAIIVRDGPGTWARNADWDEYRLTVRNLSETSVRLDRVLVIDALDQAIDTAGSRKELVRESRKTVRRHRDAGLDVKAGVGTSTLVASGTVVTAMGVGTVSAASTGALVSGGMASVSGAAAAASGMLLVGPALAAGGIVRGVNNAKVNEQIETQHTELPIVIPAAGNEQLRLFFPITPSPQRLVLAYRDGEGKARHMVVDTSVVLAGLHTAGGDDPK